MYTGTVYTYLVCEIKNVKNSLDNLILISWYPSCGYYIHFRHQPVVFTYYI